MRLRRTTDSSGKSRSINLRQSAQSADTNAAFGPKSFETMAEHFLKAYGKKARNLIYNSKQLHNLESFSSDPGINVMIINVQAFAARSEDARRIYLELDDFQSRRPIDVIKKNRPTMILDEPQKMEGKATTEKLAAGDRQAHRRQGRV